MRNNIFFTLLILGIFISTFLISYLLGKFLTVDGNVNNYIYLTAIRCIRVIIVFFWLAGLTYKKLWFQYSFKQPISVVIFSTVFLLCAYSIYNALLFFEQLNQMYYSLKILPRVGTEGLYRIDSVLGHSHIPNAIGYEFFSANNKVVKKISVHTDQSGFRIFPQELDYDKSDTLILYLGDSFTFGSLCNVENTYPYILSKNMRCRFINASVGGYGLAQILFTAEKLIPKYKPEYVIVFYADWLFGRSSIHYNTSDDGVITSTPFIAKTRWGYKYNKPIFMSSYDLKVVNNYKKSQKNLIDKFSFMRDIGKFKIKDIIKKNNALFKMLIGTIPMPGKDREKVDKYVYSKIFELCEKYHSKMVVVYITTHFYEDSVSQKYGPGYFKEIIADEWFDNIVYVNADSVLRANLKEGKDYSRKYEHWEWNGTDTVYFDGHPNGFAHHLIANAIYNEIKVFKSSVIFKDN